MNLQTLGYSGGAVPESHRVPCTSALPPERPTTNATIERLDLIARDSSVNRDRGEILAGAARRRLRTPPLVRLLLREPRS